MNFRNARRPGYLLAMIPLMAAGVVGCRTDKPVVASQQKPVVGLPEIEGHGLAIRFHDTSEPLERVHEVVDDLPAERLTDEDWAAHGIEIIRIREQDLGAVRSRLASSSEPGLRWHGQALTWRNLLPPSLPIGDRIMVTGGTEETYPGGFVGLSGRGWSLMTLDGPRVQVELAPLVEMPGGTHGRFAHLQREYLIGPGDNLLIIAGSGAWPHPPPEDTSAEAEEEAENKATMGELFLQIETETGQSRRLLMITPRFGGWLTEGQAPAEVGKRARAR